MYENYPARFPKVASRHEMSLFNVAASVALSGTVPSSTSGSCSYRTQTASSRATWVWMTG